MFNHIPAAKIIINVPSFDIIEGDEISLDAIVYPENATEKNILWSSSNTEVAEISESGVLTAIAEGSTIITATCGEVSDTCEISVKGEEVSEIPEEAGIQNLFNDFKRKISIYSVEGILIKKDGTAEDLKSLDKGIYIIFSGKDRYKIII